MENNKTNMIEMPDLPRKNLSIPVRAVGDIAARIVVNHIPEHAVSQRAKINVEER